MTSKIVFCAALISYLVFVSRFAWQGITYLRAAGQSAAYPRFLSTTPTSVYIATLLDILLFRRVFSVDKLLWMGSWTFHVSFFFVILRHVRYFFSSLPDCFTILQPIGVFFGYLLSVSLLFLIMLRVSQKKDRYVSSYNYVITGMLFLISVTGVMMRNFFRPDLVVVKQFCLGVFGLSPAVLPESPAFLMHSVMFLVLLPYLPAHFFAAPFVNLEANSRKEELRGIMHEA